MLNFWQSLPKPFLVLAPMEDVTDYVFREIVANYLPRPDVFFTEFTNADGLTSKGYDATVTRFKYSESQRPIIAQIWGTNPESLYKAGKIVKEMGFNGVDINMGCPDRAVMKKGAGSALINNPSLASEIIAAVREGAEGLPLSVKARIGYKKIQTEEWIGFLLKQKVDALTVHGRIASEQSKLPANWEEIGLSVELKNEISPSTILIGNGDIKSVRDGQDKHLKYGVDGVMVARGIFANPWVFGSDSKNHTKEEYLEILLKHVRLYDEIWGDTKSFDRMKKFFKIYIKDFPGANNLRIKLMECKSRSEVEEMLLS